MGRGRNPLIYGPRDPSSPAKTEVHVWEGQTRGVEVNVHVQSLQRWWWWKSSKHVPCGRRAASRRAPGDSAHWLLTQGSRPCSKLKLWPWVTAEPSFHEVQVGVSCRKLENTKRHKMRSWVPRAAAADISHMLFQVGRNSDGSTEITILHWKLRGTFTRKALCGWEFCVRYCDHSLIERF